MGRPPEPGGSAIYVIDPSGCQHPLADADAENLRQRITNPERDALRLFTFLTVNGMSPTNNHAEQAAAVNEIYNRYDEFMRVVDKFAHAVDTNA